jgi:hypothetical protein
MMFAVMTALAIGYRHRSEAHKRLMLLGTISLITAAIGRTGSTMVGDRSGATLCLMTAALVLMAVVYDLLSRGRVHPALIYGGTATALYQPLLMAAQGRLF